jgi:hypothetical protein
VATYLGVSESALRSASRLREAFLSAKPFKHVVIDNFFNADLASKLLTEFPAFDKKLATNEAGQTGGKAVRTDIGSVSPVYRELYKYISSGAFLDFVSQVSGIPDLLIDPQMFGGGTHENLHSQELDAHVDFNYDQSVQLHRRLNLIVYLNPEWRPEWGGALEIHSNPRDPGVNQISSYDPLFNRCVMFETNEYSWHGFPRIELPPERRKLSRKSISIYLYTKDRPAEEIAPPHATFYVQRPLPAHMKEGRTLSAEDVMELQRLLLRRDRWIEFYQKAELEKSRDNIVLVERIKTLEQASAVPITGYMLLDGPTTGLYDDNWASSKVTLRLRPIDPVKRLVLRGFRPESAPPSTARISIDGALVAHQAIEQSFEVPIHVTKADAFTIDIECEGPRDWALAAGDDRDLAFIFTELRALHL